MAEEARACVATMDAAYLTRDPLLPVCLVEVVDAFIFQHCSTYEMMGHSVREFCRVILQDAVTGHTQVVLYRIAHVDQRGHRLESHHPGGWPLLHPR